MAAVGRLRTTYLPLEAGTLLAVPGSLPAFAVMLDMLERNARAGLEEGCRDGREEGTRGTRG